MSTDAGASHRTSGSSIIDRVPLAPVGSRRVEYNLAVMMSVFGAMFSLQSVPAAMHQWRAMDSPMGLATLVLVYGAIAVSGLAAFLHQWTRVIFLAAAVAFLAALAMWPGGGHRAGAGWDALAARGLRHLLRLRHHRAAHVAAAAGLRHRRVRVLRLPAHDAGRWLRAARARRDRRLLRAGAQRRAADPHRRHPQRRALRRPGAGRCAGQLRRRADRRGHRVRAGAHRCARARLRAHDLPLRRPVVDGGRTGAGGTHGAELDERAQPGHRRVAHRPEGLHGRSAQPRAGGLARRRGALHVSGGGGARAARARAGRRCTRLRGRAGDDEQREARRRRDGAAQRHRARVGQRARCRSSSPTAVAAFDMSRIASERLGVRVSIIERMRRVGGEADLQTALGAGTTIVLSWPASARAPLATAKAEQAVLA